MIWRSTIIMFIHFTIALLLWLGYSWLSDGQGLNPLIAFPGAIILYIWHLLWISMMCEEHDCEASDVLEKFQ